MLPALLACGSRAGSAFSAKSGLTFRAGEKREGRLPEQEEIILVAQDDPYMASLPEAGASEPTLPKQSASFSRLGFT